VPCPRFIQKLCLVASCEKESSELQEYVADMLARPDATDVESDFALFKEKLTRRPEPSGDEILQTSDRYAALERELRIERERRENSEAEKTTLQLRLAALEDSWSRDRARAVMEKRALEDSHRERLQAEAAAHHAQINTLTKVKLFPPPRISGNSNLLWGLTLPPPPKKKTVSGSGSQDGC